MKRILSLAFLLFCFTQPISAIEFVDVTQQAGINYSANSFGSSWGDINNDGWPDLWLGDHIELPHLYINNRDGTFTDHLKTIIPGLIKSRDMHGAAFADYDNDGDQDLLILTGSNYGTGSSPNYFLVNKAGTLSEIRSPLNYPLGRGRTPLWFDWNNDGFLDLLAGNTPRPDGQAPTALFTQNQGEFIKASTQTGFTSAANNSFAQLFTIGTEYRPSLILNGAPFPDKLFAYDTLPFDELKNDYATTFSNLWNVRDAVIADLDGNQLPDIFVVREKQGAAELLQPEANQIAALLSVNGDEKSFSFQSNGSVEFQIYPFWHIGPNRIFIGESGINPNRYHSIFSLTSVDATGQYPHTAGVDFGVYISYDTDTQTWQVSVSSSSHFIFKLVIIGENSLESVTRINFGNTNLAQNDHLILQYESGFTDNTIAAGLQIPTPCSSVVAADFDNDMDLDLYLACQSMATNLQNILYENLGQGVFQLVDNAGGAGGSMNGLTDTVSTNDYDRDGFIDLLITNGHGSAPFADGPTQLFHNMGNDNHWLEIDLEGKKSNRDGIGAYLLLTTNDISQYRLQGGGMHRFTQDSSRIHFGLANNETADSVVIHWPSGTVQTLLNVPADQIIRVVESEGSTDLAPTQPDIPPETDGPAASNDGGDASDGGGGAASIYTLILLALLSGLGLGITQRKH
ncbi:MAG TPA: CRTAC1 family protein [Gammaproteobacteria bacterium]|nr:CRTAC1 family protein [Gammaproteobacteria bacterium]